MRRPTKPAAWRSYAGSVALHAVIVGLIALAFVSFRPRPAPQERLGISATVVPSTPARRPAPPPPEPVVEQVAPEPEPEPEPQVDAAAEERARREAAAREQEQQRLAQEAEREREQQERERVEREKAEREKAAREQAAREKAERDKAAAAAAAAAARAEREAELNARIAAEERLASARASGLMQQYVAQITSKIENNWRRPSSARPGLDCEVSVTQVPGGAVTNVSVGRCNGDAAVRESIEAAVYRASPLPLPPDPALFERNLIVTFRPED